MPVLPIALTAALIFAVVLFKLMWRVAEPNEALVISGIRTADGPGPHDGLGFKVVTGHGTLVVPGVQTVRRLSLDLREAELAIECVTHQGIPLGVRGVVIYKVGDDPVSIANAARRFLDQQKHMDQRVHNVFAGHLRAIVGSMTVEEMIRDREKLTELTRASSGMEMEKLGLIVDSLQIQEIDDPTGYISNLGRPHAAAVQSQARIAQADADREATEREQKAEALMALARRDASIKQAGFQAEVDRAAAEAKQAGPLSEAQALQEVVVQETRVAELEAAREEKYLEVSVRKPADATAYEQVTLARAASQAEIAAAEGEAQRIRLAAEAEAQRVRFAAEAEADHVRLDARARAEATQRLGEAEAVASRARGLADGEATRARGLAVADSIKARAEALATNQEAVIGQQLAEHWPAIVEAAAKPFGDIDQLVVLNGADGLSDMLAKALSQGAAGLHLARSLLAPSHNGSVDAAAEAVVRPARPKGQRPPAAGAGAAATRR